MFEDVRLAESLQKRHTQDVDHDGLAYTRGNKAEQIHGNVCTVKANRGEGDGVEKQEQ